MSDFVVLMPTISCAETVDHSDYSQISDVVWAANLETI